MSEPDKTADVEVEVDVITDPGEKADGAGAAQPDAGAAAAAAPAVEIQTAAAAEAAGEPRPLTPEQVQELIATLEREAKALGNDPAAARLHHEMGLLWEGPLKNPRNAAVCFQNAYRLAPKLVENLRAARRLFAEVGNWQMVEQLLDAEAAALDGEAEQMALLLEKARILEDRLGKPDEALACLQQARQKWPREVAVLSTLEAALEARSDPASLEEVRVGLADAVQDPSLAAQYLVSAARLCEGVLSRPSDAGDLYRRAFALRREDLAVLSAVERSAERKGDLDELLSSLQAQAQKAGAAGAPIWYRISRVWERSGQPEKALEALVAGRSVAPHDPVILDELARTYEAAARWPELAEVLKARIAKLTDTHERVGLNLRLAALYEGVLSNEDAAIDCYRTVLSIAPANQSAVAGLGKLYAKKQDWNGLYEVYQTEISTTEDPRQKAARTYKAAELLETRLDRLEEAVARYGECLTLQPGYLPAQKALVRIFEHLERWDELVALYEADLKQTSDRDQSISLLSRTAALHEERRKDLPAAVAALKRILDIAPDHLPTIRNLARLCERAAMWEDLIRTNELEASLAGDSRQVISLFHTNAEIYEEQLKQKDQAIEVYKKITLLSANYLPALKALGRLYAQAGRWADLVEMYRQEAEITPSPEQAAGLLFKAGELLEEKLDRVDDAIAVYQEVLTLSPSHFPALRALSRIYRAQKSYESLVEMLRAEVAARTDAAEKANTLFRVAALWEDELNRPELAIESYQSVLTLVPDHGPAFGALERLYAAAGNWKELALLLERELKIAAAPEAQVAAYEKLAALWLDRFQDPARAELCYEAILRLQPKHLSALKGLEALRLADRAKRVEVRSQLAAAIADPKAAAALWVSVAFDRERLGQPSVEAWRNAARLTPGDPRVVSEYERALQGASQWAELVAWYEGRLKAELPDEARLSVLLRLAEVSEWRLGSDQRALSAYRAALQLDPACVPALRGARRVLTRLGAHAEVFKLLLAEGNAARDPKGAIDLLIEAGKVAEEKLNDVNQARAAYQAVLNRDPLEARAAERLEGLLLRSGGAAELAELHLRRAMGREAARDPAGAAEEYVAAAKIFAVQPQQERRAFEALEHALRTAPTNPAALQLRGDLCLAGNRFAEAANSYLLRIEQGGDAAELAPLHYRLGVLLQDHLGEPARATAHLQTAWAADPRNLDALERLGAIQLAAANWGGAADVYRRLLEVTTDPAKLARHLIASAQIADTGLGDPATAVKHLKRALELLPGDPSVMQQLGDLYERTGNLPELAASFEQQAIHASESGDKARACQLRQRAGEIYARQGDTQKAIQSYRFAVELAPDQIPARAALADLMTKTASMPAAAIEEHRALLKLDPFRLESYHTLFRLYAASRQLDRAMCVAHVLSFCRALTEAETASFTEARGRAPKEASGTLTPEELDGVLQHPAARSPLADLMRIIGDQLHKVYEPGLEELGVGRGDRLKADNPLFRLAKALGANFELEKFEVYQGKRGGQITLVNTDPLAMVVGPDVARRNNAEQRFLFARAAFQLRNKMAIVHRLDNVRLAELMGNAVRAAVPDFNRLGKPDPEQSKRLRKAMSGKALKLLEQLAPELGAAKNLDVAAWVQASGWSADRAGLLACGDIATALQVLLREDPSLTGTRLESSEQILSALRKRRDMFELVAFVTSDDHYRLRSRLHLVLG